MNKNLITGIVMTGSAIGMGLIGWFGRKLSKLTNKVGMAVNDLASAEVNDIRQELIERSVEKAARQEVKKYAHDAGQEAVNGIRKEVKDQVKRAVDDAFDQVKASVEKEVSEQVANLDHHALRKDITEQAKKKVLEKLDGSLDDILKDFSDDLNRVKKIHTSIADALSERKPSKEIHFNLD